MRHEAINFSQKLSLFEDHWSPRVIAEMNDYQFKLVKLEGAFVWHDHPTTAETFIVLDGRLFKRVGPPYRARWRLRRGRHRLVAIGPGGVRSQAVTFHVQ